MRDGFGHEAPYEGDSNDWITPQHIIDSLGPFDLDPCASATQPWPCADTSWALPEHDGLVEPWFGNVYCNPPYGPHTAKWIKKLSAHGEGIALIFARVETKLWQEDIFTTCSGILFPNKRIQFARPDGTTPKSSSGAPSALIAWGDENAERLKDVVRARLIPGAFFKGPAYTGKDVNWNDNR